MPQCVSQSLRMLHVHLKRRYILIFFGCNVLNISIKSNCCIASFRVSVALLIFSLENLSNDVSGVLKSPTITVFPSISHFTSVSICCRYLGAPVLGAYILTWILLDWILLPLNYVLWLYFV